MIPFVFSKQLEFKKTFLAVSGSFEVPLLLLLLLILAPSPADFAKKKGSPRPRICRLSKPADLLSEAIGSIRGTTSREVTSEFFGSILFL